METPIKTSLQVIHSEEEKQFILLQRKCKAWLDSQLLPPTLNDISKVMTIVMTGEELGLKPLTSLRQIDIVQGRPTLKAEVMRALVFQHFPGAIINFITPGDKAHVECEIEACRPGGKSQFFKYTLEMAKQAGLLEKSNWKKDLAAMLRARASAAAVRAVFPDVVSGCYTPEEMGGDIIEGEIVHESEAKVRNEAKDSRSINENAFSDSGLPRGDKRRHESINEPTVSGESGGYQRVESDRFAFESAPMGNGCQVSKIQKQTPSQSDYPKTNPNWDQEPCTKAQIVKLNAMGRRIGYDDKELHKLAGVDSFELLSKGQIQILFNQLQAEIDSMNTDFEPQEIPM